MISKEKAINSLWKALYQYEDEMEQAFLESKDLDISEWFMHRLFIQNMNDIDRQTILNMLDEEETCKGCKHESIPYSHYNCLFCKRRYTDYYENM